MSTEQKPHSRQDVLIIRRSLQGMERSKAALLSLSNLEQQFQRLEEQLEATEQRLAREISEHADRQQALRQLQFLAVNGQNRHSDPIEALCEIESRAREALNPASERPDGADIMREIRDERIDAILGESNQDRRSDA